MPYHFTNPEAAASPMTLPNSQHVLNSHSGGL